MRKKLNKIHVYFAGPLFTHAELVWNDSLAKVIREIDSSMVVFLPQVETSDALSSKPPDFATVKNICIGGIDASNVVVAILDGADADSGTCFECGYAYGRGTPIVGVRTDVRSGEDEGINAMLTRSCHSIVRLDTSAHPSERLSRLAASIVENVHAAIQQR